MKRDASTLRFRRVFCWRISEISEDKIAAYHATHYRVGMIADGFTLRIGQHSPELRGLYNSTGQSCGVFITAFNPFGQAEGKAENEAAHVRLGDDLRAVSSCVIEGEGADPTGLWPAEKSYSRAWRRRRIGLRSRKTLAPGRRRVGRRRRNAEVDRFALNYWFGRALGRGDLIQIACPDIPSNKAKKGK